MPVRPEDPFAKPAAPLSWPVHVTLPGLIIVLLLGLFPAIANAFFLVQIAANAAAVGLVALSIMLLGGWGGMVTLSQMTVAGLAGYFIAIFGVDGAGLVLEWAWWAALPVALILATAAAGVIGAVSIRTSGIHTIMITLAIGVAFFYLANQNYTLFNGFTGFSGLAPPELFGVNWRDPVAFYYLCITLAAIGYALVVHLGKSPFGLALKAGRDNARRMAAIGYSVKSYRIWAHVIAGCMAATGGVLLVWLNGRISPGTVGVGPLIDILIVAVIGGMRHPAGPFLGALVFIVLKTFAIDLIDPERFNTLIGMVFILVVLFSPDGLLGLIDKVKSMVRRNSSNNW